MTSLRPACTKEDRYCITVDKNINWDGSKIANPDFRDSTSTTGYVQIVFVAGTPGDDGHVHLRHRSARTAASATATTRRDKCERASRATPTTTATRRARCTVTRAPCVKRKRADSRAARSRCFRTASALAAVS